MSDELDDTALEKRIRLPEPDIKNITVLTENLPNEPVLPWHRFDSPWLNRDGETEADSATDERLDNGHDQPSDDDTEQLSLQLEVEIVPNAPDLQNGSDSPESDSPTLASKSASSAVEERPCSSLE